MRTNERVDACAARELVVPMDRREHAAGLHPLGHQHAHDDLAMGAGEPCEPGRLQAQPACILRAHLDEGLGHVVQQSRGLPRPRHRVPLVTNAAGVENERIAGRYRRSRRPIRCRHEAGAAIGGEEAAIGEEPGLGALPPAGGCGHWNGASASYCSAVIAPCAAMSRSLVPAFPAPVRAAYSAKISPGLLQENPSRKPMRRATSAICHQSGRASPGGGRNGRWREMQRSELVTVPSFSPQAAEGSSTCASAVVSVCRSTSDTTTNGQARSASRTRSASGRLTDRIGGHDPQRLDAAVADRVEHFDRLETRPAGDPRRLPELLHDAPVLGISELHVGGQHVGETADLASAHRVGLSGDRERPHARPADTAGHQVAVDDRVDLVGAGRSIG